MKLAAQLLSRSTGAGILALKHILDERKDCKHPMPQETEDTAEFVFMIDSLFDLFNVSRPIMDSRPTRKAYGLDKENQDQVLDKAYAWLLETRRIEGNSIGHAKALKPFQKGLLQDINALKLLYDDLKENFNITYILTERLNQDCLERMFGYLRGKEGGLKDHPSPTEVHYRLKNSILGNVLQIIFLKYLILCKILIITALVNQGGLNIPPKNLTEKTRSLSDVFDAIDFLSASLMDNLLKGAEHIEEYSVDQKKTFFKTAIYKKIKELNTVLKNERQTKRRSGCEKTQEGEGGENNKDDPGESSGPKAEKAQTATSSRTNQMQKRNSRGRENKQEGDGTRSGPKAKKKRAASPKTKSKYKKILK